MRKKNFIFMICFISIFLVNSLIPVDCASVILNDDTQDIYQVLDGKTPEKNIDRYPEIDIESIEINDTSIIITFVATPNESWVHKYDFAIWWNGKDVDNITNGIFDDNHRGVATQLVDDSGSEIVKFEEFDTVSIIGRSFVFPLLNASLISNILTPREIEITARFFGFEIGYGGFFRDEFDYKSKGLPGYTTIIAIVSISSIIVMTYIKRRK